MLANAGLPGAAEGTYHGAMTSIDLFRFIRSFRKLPPDRQLAVHRLVDLLGRSSGQSDRDARIVDAAASLSEPAFAAIWDNDDDAEYDRL